MRYLLVLALAQALDYSCLFPYPGVHYNGTNKLCQTEETCDDYLSQLFPSATSCSAVNAGLIIQNKMVRVQRDCFDGRIQTNFNFSCICPRGTYDGMRPFDGGYTCDAALYSDVQSITTCEQLAAKESVQLQSLQDLCCYIERGYPDYSCVCDSHKKRDPNVEYVPTRKTCESHFMCDEIFYEFEKLHTDVCTISPGDDAYRYTTECCGAVVTPFNYSCVCPPDRGYEGWRVLGVGETCDQGLGRLWEKYDACEDLVRDTALLGTGFQDRCCGPINYECMCLPGTAYSPNTSFEGKAKCSQIYAETGPEDASCGDRKVRQDLTTGPTTLDQFCCQGTVEAPFSYDCLCLDGQKYNGSARAFESDLTCDWSIYGSASKAPDCEGLISSFGGRVLLISASCCSGPRSTPDKGNFSCLCGPDQFYNPSRLIGEDPCSEYLELASYYHQEADCGLLLLQMGAELRQATKACCQSLVPDAFNFQCMCPPGHTFERERRIYVNGSEPQLCGVHMNAVANRFFATACSEMPPDTQKVGALCCVPNYEEKVAPPDSPVPTMALWAVIFGAAGLAVGFGVALCICWRVQKKRKMDAVLQEDLIGNLQ